MKQLLILLVFWIAVNASPQAFSAVGQIPLEAVARDADLVIIGRVGAITSAKQSAPSKEVKYVISSKVEIFSEKTIKGTVDRDPIVVEILGGRVGEEVFVSEDTARFTTGEQVIIFLKRIEGKDTYSVVGMAQGKYEVKDDMVIRKKMPIKEFEKEVQGLIEAK